MAFRGCSSDSKTMFSCNCSYLLLCLQENFKNFQPLVLLKSEDFRGRGGGVHSVLQLLPCGHVSAKACSGSGSTCPFHTWEVLFTVILSLDCLHSSLSSLSLFLSVLSSLTLSLSWCHLPCHYLSRGSCLMGYTWPRKDKNCQNFKPKKTLKRVPIFPPPFSDWCALHNWPRALHLGHCSAGQSSLKFASSLGSLRLRMGIPVMDHNAEVLPGRWPMNQNIRFLHIYWDFSNKEWHLYTWCIHLDDSALSELMPLAVWWCETQT